MLFILVEELSRAKQVEHLGFVEAEGIANSLLEIFHSEVVLDVIVQSFSRSDIQNAFLWFLIIAEEVRIEGHKTGNDVKLDVWFFSLFCLFILFFVLVLLVGCVLFLDDFLEYIATLGLTLPEDV